MNSRTQFLLVVCVLAMGAACSPTRSTEQISDQPMHGVWVMQAGEEIQALLAGQQTAWNAGDIDGFMKGYWNSPQLRFASGDSITHGWQELLERYKARYSSQELMGTLSLNIVETTVYDDENASVFGKWALKRAEQGDAGGLFTLTLRRIDGEWRIVADHTS